MDWTLKPQLRSQRRLIFGILILVLLIGVFISTDWEAMRAALIAAQWGPLPGAVLLTVISYACISYSFALVSRLLGVKASIRDLAGIGFISTVINHVMTAGGAVGYSVRYQLMKQRGICMQDVLSISILHYYLTSIVMLAMLPVGILYLFMHSTLSNVLAAAMIIAAGLLFAIFLLASGLIFSKSTREALLAPIGSFVRMVIRRDIDLALLDFDRTMTKAVDAMRARPWIMLTIMGLVVVDWLASAAVLWFSFNALGVQIQPGVLMAGFVIGIMAGVLSMIPGGLGIQEGSMAGIFALMGVPLHLALLAAILFRVLYYLLPLLLSMAIYFRLSGGLKKLPD